jgi:F-type H+-transporting ATPase subunit epsilon
MNLKILLPYRIFAQKSDVSRIVAETSDGSFGLLPNRLDCVAALVPGILIYTTQADGTVYVAVDEGVLVKNGAEVLVSVRRAISGINLGELHESVRREFQMFDARDREVRTAVAKMEGALVGRLAEFHHGR